MKYIIIGGGPSGLSLAYILALNNKNIILIEKDNKLGGSWNHTWIENKYFSENSPRVLANIDNTKKLLNHIGINDNDLKNIYGNIFESNYKFMKFLFKYLNIFDYIKFIYGIIKYKLIKSNITVYDWIIKNKLSKKSIKGLKILCILICDRLENTNINDFMCSITLILPKQMKKPNKWHNLIENYLKTKNNILILKNTEVIKLNTKFNNSINLIYLNNNKILKIKKNDKVFLCTQSNNIYPILKNSSENIKNNWMKEDKMKEWCENTYYIGFGFQLHFDKKIKFSNKWCWSCENDWTIIILPVSNWLKPFSKDKNVKTVWSCCIVDMDSKSSHINKTPNECNKNEIINECIYQIKNS